MKDFIKNRLRELLLKESIDNNRIWSGKEVNNHIKSITPFKEDLPIYFMKELINPRNFKIQKINLNELLNSDEDFRHYYDNGNVEDRYKYDEYSPSKDELEHELVIVDGILLDGYNRASELLKMGVINTNGFVAIPQKLK
jgi:hypothetical protein